MRDPKERLRDILDAIANIERYAARGRVAFETDEVIQNSFVRHLQIIGEAAYAIPRELRDQHPGISWAKMTGMRHVVIQDHFMIDDDIVWDDLDRELVWDTVQRDLPNLKHKIDQMLRQLEENR